VNVNTVRSVIHVNREALLTHSIFTGLLLADTMNTT